MDMQKLIAKNCNDVSRLRGIEYRLREELRLAEIGEKEAQKQLPEGDASPWQELMQQLHIGMSKRQVDFIKKMLGELDE